MLLSNFRQLAILTTWIDSNFFTYIIKTERANSLKRVYPYQKNDITAEKFKIRDGTTYCVVRRLSCWCKNEMVIKITFWYHTNLDSCTPLQKQAIGTRYMFVGEITDLQTSQKVVRSITDHRLPILCDHAKTPKNCQLLSGVVSTLMNLRNSGASILLTLF